MRSIILITIVTGLLLSACKKISINNDQVIESFQVPDEILADGTSQVELVIKINKSADAAKRKLVVETSAGLFTPVNLKTTTIEALFEAGELVARVKLKAPTSAGKIYVSVKPEIRNAYNDFIIRDSLTAIASIPSSIFVSASAFGVQTAFVGEVQITGTLKNGNGGNVSSGYKVQFADFFMNGAPAGGRFRAIQNSSDDNSKVSAFYSPGLVAPGTSLYVMVTLLDAAGNPTGTSNSVILTVTP